MLSLLVFRTQLLKAKLIILFRSLRSYFGSSVEQIDNMGLVSFVENIHRKRRVTVTDRISHADCLLEMEKKRKKKMENGNWKMTPADPDSNLAL